LEKVVKAFREFIARDLVFIVSGGAVVGTFLYVFNRVPNSDDSWILFALLGGIGYFVAYAIQDVLCIFHVLPSTPVSSPNGFVRWMYERYNRTRWAAIESEIEPDEARHTIPRKRQPELERLITFQQIGTAGGPCVLLCGIGFLVVWLCNRSAADLAVAIAGGILGLVLICLAWLKAAQRAQFLATVSEISRAAV